MEEIQFDLDAKNKGRFIILENGEPLGEMAVVIDGDKLSVFHTEVLPKAEGKGFAKKMLDHMVEYARKNNLKVIPLCPYVLAQFKRNAKIYADVWKPGS